ncbi:MAG: T9SS type A sorting domain-containing protein [Candidatus Marinimicrobia bacterium]|nr:T9SS type A sorting domain-containing protein [Candidatus Neomarinimicrobiota bacterium]
MKKRTIFSITLLFILQLITQAQTADPPLGSGTLNDPYRIGTLNNLFWLSQTDRDAETQIIWNAYFVQTIDIDASATAGWDAGSGFSPIGDYADEFGGVYDGQGHTIHNLIINRPGQDYVAMFGRNSDNAVVKNLGITGNDTISGSRWTAALVGLNFGVVDSCFATVNIKGHGDSGGLVGENQNLVTQCYATGDVNAPTSTYIGGLVGLNSGTAALIELSFATGEVNGNNQVGGLCGRNSYGIIRNSYARGAAHKGDAANNWAEIGGLVGRLNSTNAPYIINCYSTGEVNFGSYSAHSGGLVGSDTYVNDVSSSFWDMETSNRDDSHGGTGKTTAEMKSVVTYTSTATTGLDTIWDFVGNPNDDASDNDYWTIDPAGIVNDGYPYLDVTPMANEPPVANDLQITTDINTSIDFTLSGSDPNGDTLTYSVIHFTANGDLMGTAPNLTYDPFFDFMGEDSLRFRVSDGEYADTATVRIGVLTRPGVLFSGRAVFTDASGPEMCGAGANAYMEMVESGCGETTEGWALSENTDFLDNPDSLRLTMGGFMLAVDSFYCIDQPWGDYRVYTDGHAQIMLGTDTLMRINNITMSSDQDYLASEMHGEAYGDLDTNTGDMDFLTEMDPLATNRIHIFFNGSNQVIQNSCGFYDFEFFLAPDSSAPEPNQPPEPFLLAGPADGGLVSISDMTVGSELNLTWTAATDANGDSLEYLVELQHGDSSWVSVLPDTSVWLSIDTVANRMASLGQDSLTLAWNVEVTDGIDTVATTNGPFILTFAHWDIHAETPQLSFNDTSSVWYLGDTLTINVDVSNAGPLDFNHEVGLAMMVDNPLVTLVDSTDIWASLPNDSTVSTQFRVIAGLGLTPETTIDFGVMTFAPDCDMASLPACLDSNSVSFSVPVYERPEPNQPPEPFLLAGPADGGLVSISDMTVGSELNLTWTAATDANGDSLEYLVELQHGDSSWVATLPDTSIWLSIDTVANRMAALDQDSLSLRWQVKVTDGVDTVAAANGPFFTIFAHWNIHAENIQISFSDTNSVWYLGDTLTISAEITNAGPLDFNHPVGLRLTTDNPLVTLLDSAAWLNGLSMGLNRTLNFRAIAGLGLVPETEIEFALTTEAQDCASEPIPMCLDGNSVSFQATVHEPVVSIQPESIPATYSLGNNYPNPFNPSTTIRFGLPEAGVAKLTIYDVQGKPVQTLVNRHLPAGYQSVAWQGQNDAGRQMSTGVYFARLEVNGFSQTRKMILMK